MEKFERKQELQRGGGKSLGQFIRREGIRGASFRKYEDVGWTMGRVGAPLEGCAWQLVGRVRLLCFHQLLRGRRKGRSVRKGRSFGTWEGFEDDKRPHQLAATCATAARCSPLSLSLRLQRDQFRGKTRGAPSCVTYADTLRVIREPPWFLPYLDSTCSFVPWVLILFFFSFLRVCD